MRFGYKLTVLTTVFIRSKLFFCCFRALVVLFPCRFPNCTSWVPSLRAWQSSGAILTIFSRFLGRCATPRELHRHLRRHSCFFFFVFFCFPAASSPVTSYCMVDLRIPHHSMLIGAFSMLNVFLFQPHRTRRVFQRELVFFHCYLSVFQVWTA